MREVRKKKCFAWWKKPGFVGGVVCLLVVCASLRVAYAKYIYQWEAQRAEVAADKFYFTTDLTGDSVMVPQEDGQGYQFSKESTTGSWHLSGAAQHDIHIQIRNYYDELRITERDITFEAKIDKAISDKGVRLILQDTSGDRNTVTGRLKGNAASSVDLGLVIPAQTVWNYEDNTVVSLRIESTEPYEKIYILNFYLHAADTALRYCVADSVGSPYAELVIMNNVTDEKGEITKIQPWIQWPENLEIDNTNKLTFTKDENGFTVQPGMERRNMQISEALPTGCSESILFFKRNPDTDYSRTDQVAVVADDRYVIDLTK